MYHLYFRLNHKKTLREHWQHNGGAKWIGINRYKVITGTLDADLMELGKLMTSTWMRLITPSNVCNHTSLIIDLESVYVHSYFLVHGN